jgi:hypothetical protein
LNCAVARKETLFSGNKQICASFFEKLEKITLNRKGVIMAENAYESLKKEMENRDTFITVGLKLLKDEVVEIHNKIKQACECNEKLKKIYKGCIIFLSPLFYKPKILYLGINPGSGYYRKNKKIIEQFEPLSKQDTGYEPWKQIQYCFNTIGKKDYLNEIVKINYYFFATYNEKELRIFFDLLPAELRFEILQKSDQWIKTIITEIAPEYIICGGFKAANYLKKLFPEYTYLEGSKHTLIAKINNVIVLTYKRLFSVMRNRNDYIKYLNKYIQ